MRISIPKSMRAVCALAAGMVIGHGQMTWAGWTGSMNGAGYGKAKVNVTSSTSVSNSVATTNMFFPSAAMSNYVGYVFGGRLPNGSSPLTLARILGKAGYVWQATTVAKNGDKTDNSELQGFVIPVSPLSTTTLEVTDFSMDTSDTNGCAAGQALYTFTWHWTGSDSGAAQQLKWYEFDGELPLDFDGDIGSLSNAVLVAGPWLAFVTPPQFCEGTCPTNFDEVLTYSFCANADSNKIYMVTDGIAESVPCATSFTGFQSPIGGADATGGTCVSPVRRSKMGSTIPVKMILQTCSGKPITTGNHKITVVNCANPTVILNGVAADAATTGNLFRKTDPKGGWHFNLNTKRTGMTAGIWQIIATLADGSVHSVYIQLTP
jgi:hypothetical protein